MATKTISFPIDDEIRPLLRVAAKRESRTVASFIRNLVLQDLVGKRLIDEDMKVKAASALVGDDSSGDETEEAKA